MINTIHSKNDNMRPPTGHFHDRVRDGDLLRFRAASGFGGVPELAVIIFSPRVEDPVFEDRRGKIGSAPNLFDFFGAREDQKGWGVAREQVRESELAFGVFSPHVELLVCGKEKAVTVSSREVLYSGCSLGLQDRDAEYLGFEDVFDFLVVFSKAQG
jgi:hypothetical protein